MMIWLILPSIFSFVQAQSCSTELDILSGEAKELIDCNLINRLNSCTERFNEETDYGELYFKMLNNTYGKEDLLINDPKYAKALNKSFGKTKDYMHDDSKNINVHVFDWLFTNGMDPATDEEKVQFKNSFLLKYNEYAKNYRCIPQVKFKDYLLTFPTPSLNNSLPPKFKTQSELKNFINSPEQIELWNKYRQDQFTHPHRLQKLETCSKDLTDNREQRPIELELTPCVGILSHFFSNNKWKLNEEDLSSVLSDPKAVDLKKCIDQRLAKNMEIESITIESSSSSLNNTDEAQKMFCEKGFLALSKERALTAKNDILPKFIAEDTLAKIETKIKFHGSNGDGTSGPCPYKMVNDKEVWQSEFKPGGAKTHLLDESRFVKAHIRFKPKSIPLKGIPEYIPSRRCRRIEFVCE